MTRPRPGPPPARWPPWPGRGPQPAASRRSPRAIPSEAAVPVCGPEVKPHLDSTAEQTSAAVELERADVPELRGDRERQEAAARRPAHRHAEQLAAHSMAAHIFPDSEQA